MYLSETVGAYCPRLPKLLLNSRHGVSVSDLNSRHGGSVSDLNSRHGGKGLLPSLLSLSFSHTSQHKSQGSHVGKGVVTKRMDHAN